MAVCVGVRVLRDTLAGQLSLPHHVLYMEVGAAATLSLVVLLLLHAHAGSCTVHSC